MRNRDHKKEQKLHEEAVQLIVAAGFEGLTMQKLAKATGISAATIYIYFKNREDLLNKVYNRLEQLQHHATMHEFNPLLSLEEGLWLLWKNQYDYARENTLQVQFLEQFRHSPLIHHAAITESNTRGSMAIFFQNAIRRNELRPMATEMITALALGPLHTILKINREQKMIGADSFVLSERKLRKLFEQTLSALQPQLQAT